ncbi:MAG: ATP-binding cassette domain-containing protein [Bacteroidales bacterium]|nr:ATP-binding cassette domain-containing protein [Bacteroidales bacterium]
MHIRLNKIKPTVTVGFFDPNSEIWEKEVELQEGKFNLINSTSGRGKSSLTAFIYGTRKDFTGEVLLNNNDNKLFSFAEWSEIRQKKLSIVFQDLRLFGQLTAMENILVKADLTNTTSVDEILDMAEKLKVKKLLEKKCMHMSFGEQQRLAIIRALSQPFEYLLMDEPFSHLDKGNIKIASELILKKCDENKAGFMLCTLGDYYDLEYDQVKSV